jgi:hypothetical protein
MKVAYGRAAFQPGYPDLVANVPVLAMAAQYECLVDGSDGAAIVAEVAPQNGDVVVTHPRVSGFHGTALDVTLRGAGIDTIVLMGVATNLTIESTARAAPTWVTALSSSPTHAQPYRRRHTTHRWNRLRCLPTSSLPTTSLESSVAPLHTNNTHGMGEVDVAAIADDVNIAGLWPPR